MLNVKRAYGHFTCILAIIAIILPWQAQAIGGSPPDNAQLTGALPAEGTTFSSSPIVALSWTPGFDIDGDLDGYSVVVDSNASTNPDLTVDYTSLPSYFRVFEGVDTYFHIIAVDLLGNQSTLATYGPWRYEAANDDSDNDTLSDSFEEFYFKDDWVFDAYDDPDEDYLTNMRERDLGFDPTVFNLGTNIFFDDFEAGDLEMWSLIVTANDAPIVDSSNSFSGDFSTILGQADTTVGWSSTSCLGISWTPDQISGILPSSWSAATLAFEVNYQPNHEAASRDTFAEALPLSLEIGYLEIDNSGATTGSSTVLLAASSPLCLLAGGLSTVPRSAHACAQRAGGIPW